MLKPTFPARCAVVLLLVLPGRVAAATATPDPARTPPPQIIHIVTTPFCARLHDQVRPAVAMILENDQTIAKSPTLFKHYARGVFAAQDAPARQYSNGAPAANDSIYAQSPEASMAVQQMSNLVSPIAQNIIAAQKALTSPEFSQPTGSANNDRQLDRIKNQLLETIGFQSASLDLLNGFVTTQQMGALQHAGEEYLASIQSVSPTQTIAGVATPGPLQDPNTPGLAPNPYSVDPTAIPGLAVGYNPISRIIGGVQWLQVETGKRENTAAETITAALKECAKQ